MAIPAILGPSVNRECIFYPDATFNALFVLTVGFDHLGVHIALAGVASLWAMPAALIPLVNIYVMCLFGLLVSVSDLGGYIATAA